MTARWSDHILGPGTTAERPLPSEAPYKALYLNSEEEQLQINTGLVWVEWIAAHAAPPTDTDGLAEGATNLYFTVARAQAALAADLANKADLVGGLVPSAQLPSYVDDVVEAANFAALPGPGEIGKIYVTLDNNKAWRWGGVSYYEISAGPASTDAVPEGSTNKYFTDARAQTALTTLLAGKADLAGGKVTDGQLPFHIVVVDYFADLPGAGDLSTIYIVRSNSNAYFWDPSTLGRDEGSGYSELFPPDIAITDVGGLTSALADKADLVGGKVPSAQLPAYVDDVVEYANFAAFPGVGTTGLIYVALDTNKIFRWSGSAYIEVSPGPGSTDSVVEGATNLYFTNARAQAALTALLAGKEPTIAAGTAAQYWRGDKTWQTLDKTAVGLSNVDNTSDETRRSIIDWTRPTGAKRHNMDRHVPSSITISNLTSGKELLSAIYLVAGDVLSSITVTSGSTGMTSGSNQWFTLRDYSFNLLKTTADDTSTAWAANTKKTLSFTGGTYTVPTTGWYLVGVVVVATTVPNLSGSSSAFAVSTIVPQLAYNSTTAVTTPGTAANPLTTAAQIGPAFYTAVS